jgi:hypothetical protein
MSLEKIAGLCTFVGFLRAGGLVLFFALLTLLKRASKFLGKLGEYFETAPHFYHLRQICTEIYLLFIIAFCKLR